MESISCHLALNAMMHQDMQLRHRAAPNGGGKPPLDRRETVNMLNTCQRPILVKGAHGQLRLKRANHASPEVQEIFCNQRRLDQDLLNKV